MPKQGEKVPILNFLLALCILCGGGPAEKAKFLFTLFNIDQSGLFKEEEHANFMRLARIIFQKLKLVGSLDWNENDIVFLALKARSYHTSKTNTIEYKPGLTMEDFLNWLCTSEECKTVTKFFGILNQLCSIIEVLKIQGQNLSDILSEKVRHCYHRSDPVPAIPSSVFTTSNNKVFPVFRNQSIISLCFRRDSPSTRRLYLKCDKVAHAADGNSPRRYFLTSFHSFDCSSDCPFQKISLSGLQSHGRYQLTVFSGTLRYEAVEITTLAKPVGASKDSSLCVLPGSLAAEDVDGVVNSSALLRKCSDYVFTGSVCSIDSVLMQSLAYIGHPSDADSSRFSAALAAAVDTAYSNEWDSKLSLIFSLCKSMRRPTGRHSSTAISRVVNKQVLCFDGMGPWSSEQADTARQRVGARGFRRVAEAISAVHRRFASSVVPPVFHRTQGGVTSVLVGGGERHAMEVDDIWRSLLEGHRLSPAAPLAASALQLLDYLHRRVEEDKGVGTAVGSEHMIVIMQSPLDIMLSQQVGSQERFLPDNLKSSNDSTSQPSVNPKLTGRHELGESISHLVQSICSYVVYYFLQFMVNTEIKVLCKISVLLMATISDLVV